MSDVLSDFSVSALIAAIKAVLFARRRYVGSSPKVELHDSPDVTWLRTGIPPTLLNAILRTQGFYVVATLPEARRQGIGMAMTLAPLREARALGYRTGILHASRIGMSMYRRLGFREYCKMSRYAWADETDP